MRTREWMNRLVSAVGFAALLAVGCQESTGSRLVTVQVSLARADAATGAALAPQDLTTGVVDPNNVTSLTVNLESVQLQTVGSEGWQTVQPTGTPPVIIDLLGLPSTAIPTALGEVTLETGACKARLFVTDAKITFAEPFQVGQLQIDAGEHDVTSIPSGSQTGLKVDGKCTVDEDVENVTLAFDGDATVFTVAVTPSGQILLTPVIRIVQTP